MVKLILFALMLVGQVIINNMRFELEKFHRNISDEELIKDLKNVAEMLNKPTVTIDEYNEKGKYHNTTLTRRFGSWFKTLELANLKKTRNLNISGEELFHNILNVWEKLGRQPRYNEMIKPLSEFSAGTYDKRFGRWSLALEKFIEYINNTITDDFEESNIQSNKEDNSKPKHKTKRWPNWRLRFLVMRRDDFKCQSCGRSPANEPGIILHIDHITSWDKGGETVLENLQTLCSMCNIGKSNL